MNTVVNRSPTDSGAAHVPASSASLLVVSDDTAAHAKPSESSDQKSDDALLALSKILLFPFFMGGACGSSSEVREDKSLMSKDCMSDVTKRQNACLVDYLEAHQNTPFTMEDYAKQSEKCLTKAQNVCIRYQ